MSLTNIKRFKPVHKYYGQLVLGPPGAGKTTYCCKMSQLLRKFRRKVVIVNLDPANELMSYEPDIDIRQLIVLEEVMDQYNLGPNGALLYCMEFLEQNIDWLLNQIEGENSTNFIFDMPGQVELYCHHKSLSNIFSKLSEQSNLQLCVVHLVDSHHCSDAGKFISALMLSLSAMLKIGLPHINLLTKVDLLKKHMDKLQFGIDFYTDVLDLNYLVDCLDTDAFTKKYKKLNEALVSVIEDYSLVSFQLVDMLKDDSLVKVKNLVDKANGHVFKAEEGRHINSMLACAMGVGETNDIE
ncbi:LOW QUALITY PROTEIN: GPN-loop GTPase 2-like [Cydia pomonella]|uniref:GPN-loop GTPase 2-like n=1 Tax=Cydia pomonella TaxID=82600 RepID=UPI002ADDC5E4|nr:GPN-loop GTPase 2-like [Cydia pomonella]XP_061710249.1 GPN-loop GTPase 2-like [Cydia pomonella]XP_061710250.1 GPN-loop GTPase 2-like [Cydia pomonella]XP_061710251.1 GPN-loop GTPase 2-like [Cydia pomonella]XP_061728598.1 LOW QUALITY PROTEIN: GPN-loop GTPase 2-like [Cydia pomonella]